MVQGAADGPQVHLVVVWLCLDKLRRQVKRRADSRAGSYATERLQFGYPKVAELNAAAI